MVRPTPRAFPSIRTVAFTGFVPIHSGGTARALHPSSLTPESQYGGTIGENDKTCQGPCHGGCMLVSVRRPVVPSSSVNKLI